MYQTATSAQAENQDRSSVRVVSGEVETPPSPSVVCASYERVSTLEQGRHGYSLDNQRRTLLALAEANGYVLPPHLMFRDGETEDASGSRSDLPALTAMLAAAARRDFSVLLVSHTDRLSRDLGKLLAIREQLRGYGVTVVRPGRPTDDSPETELADNFEGVIAQYEKARILYRTMAGKREKAERGEVIGMGRPPYGYTFTHDTLPSGKRRVNGLRLDPVTSPIVARIFDLLRHRSTADVAGLLNNEGIPGPRGKRWTPDVVYDVARHAVYMGEWRYGRNHRQVTADDPSIVTVPVPAIIERATWEAVQSAIDRRRTGRRQRIPRDVDPFVLRGMLTCGHCGGLLHTHLNTGIRYYRCGCRWPSRAARRGKPTCVLADVHAEGVEEELWRALAVALLDAERLATGLAGGVARRQDADQARQDRLAAIDRERSRHRHRLANLVDELMDLGPAARDVVREKIRGLESIIATLDRQRDDLAAVCPVGLSADDAADIAAFAAKMREGLIHATPADLRELAERLNVRGAVFLDRDRGIQLCRKRTNQFRIDWQADIELGGTEAQVNNWIVHKIGDAGVINTLKTSVSGIDESLWTRLPGLAPGQAIVSFTHMQRPVLTSINPTPAKLRMVD